MRPDELVALFDQQAAGYDQQWARTAAIRDCLYLVLEPFLSTLPADAHVLCVGAGTGAEMAHFAQRFPGWTFTAVEPSGRMLDACRARAEADGFAARCRFHEGVLDTLPASPPFHLATCFLVSQFLLDRAERVRFFAGIASRLHEDGLLASSDLAADVTSADYAMMLPAWMRMMASADVSAEAIARFRTAYTRDVAVLPPAEVAALIVEGGFERALPFFQAGLIHGWVSHRGETR